MKCAGDKACVWPVVKDGLCAQHLKDRELDMSDLGSTMQMFGTMDGYSWRAPYGSVTHGGKRISQ